MSIDLDSGHVPARHIGRRIRDAREDAGLSQAELGTATGIGGRTIQRYERGDVQVKRPALVAIALATGAPLTWLETGQAPRGEGPDGGQGALLPHLDSNQKPFGYRLAS